MSFILDALKRAERERAQGSPPAASQVIQQRAVPPARQSKWLVITLMALCVLLGVTVATIVWLVQRQSQPSAATAVATASPAVEPVTVATTPAVPPETKMSSLEDLSDDEPAPTADDPAEPAPTTADSPETSTAAPSRAPPVELQSEATPPPASRREPRAVSRTEFASGTRSDALPRPSSPSHGPIPGPVVQLPLHAPGQQQQGLSMATAAAPAPSAPVAVTQPAAAVASSDATPALSASLHQMPEAYRSQFPQLSVDIHVYNDDPKRRFVMVAGKRYHEGDTLAEGPRILAIVPEGMVLEWQGQRVVYGLTR